MGIYDLNQIDTTDLTSGISETTFDTEDTNLEIVSSNWKKNYGIYLNNPDFKSMIDRAADWIAGLKLKAKDKTKQKELDKIKGNGKQTAREISLNQIRTALFNGVSYAEIIKDKASRLKNLKSQNPGTIEVIKDESGMIVNYWQVAKAVTNINGLDTSQPKKVVAIWKPEDIFHLNFNQTADSTTGTGLAETLEEPLKKLASAEDVMNKIFRRIVYPVTIIKASTDDANEMATLKTKYVNSRDEFETIVVPMETIEFEFAQIKAAIDDYLYWLRYIKKKIVLGTGVPEVILGGLDQADNEGSAKIIYMGHTHITRVRQIWYEEQWKSQIGFEIKLEEPPKLEDMMERDMSKQGSKDPSGGPNSMRGSNNLNPKEKER